LTDGDPRISEKLAKGSYFLILDNIVHLALGAIFWIVLAKLMEAASLGQTMVVIAFATSVIGFAGYGVQVTISKYMSECNARGLPNASRRVLTLGLRFASAVSVSIAVAIAFLSGYIADAYHDPSMTVLLVIAVLTFLPSQTIFSALMGAFQGSHKSKYALETSSIYQVIRLALAVFLVTYGFGNIGVIISFFISSIIAVVFGYFYFVPRILMKKSGDSDTNVTEVGGLRQLIRFSSHNYVAVGMKTMIAQVGLLIVGTQNFELAAFYGLSVLISNLVGGVLVAVSKSILPAAAEEWAKGNDNRFRRTLNSAVRISLIISGLGFLVLMVDPSMALGLISEQYIEASLALRILVVSSIVYHLGSVLTSILNAANRPGEVSKNAILAFSITLALTFLLTPPLGVDGAAVAMLAGSVASLALACVSLKIKENLTLSVSSSVKPAISMIIGLIAGLLAMLLFHNAVVSTIVGVGAYGVLLMGWRVTTRKEIGMLLAIMRKR
jgi:O-antigen/teichoic acid export membrane protein